MPLPRVVVNTARSAESGNDDIPMRAEFQECFFGQVHKPVHLLFRTLEVVDGKGVYRDDLDVEG